MSMLFSADGRKKELKNYLPDPFHENASAKIGDNPFPTNPMSDRAKGFIDQGRVKSAITNYGSFINWDFHPSGIWGDYSYLPAVSFVGAVPGNKSSAHFSWQSLETIQDDDGVPVYSIWESSDAYDDWYPVSGDTVYKGVLFDMMDDDGIYNPDNERFSADQINGDKQYYFNHDDRKLIVSTFGDLDPNKTTARVGLIYPWALRPALISREPQFDFYDYGEDLEEWTEDDNYVYYGANAAESHFIDTDYKTDWHASTMSRTNSHQTEYNSSDIFGDTPWVAGDDTYPVLAHSAYSNTWPTEYNPITGLYEAFWPGWWSQDFNINLPG